MVAKNSFSVYPRKFMFMKCQNFATFWIGCVGFWSYSSSGIFQVEVSRLSNMVVLSRFLWDSNHFLFLLPGVKGSCIFRIDFTLDLSWKQAKCIIRSALWNKNLYRKVMFYGLISHKFWEESDLDMFWTHVVIVLTRVGLMLTCVRLMFIRVDSCRTRFYLCRLLFICVGSCWLVLTCVGTRALE